MTNTPYTTLLIVVRNEKDYIGRAITSLLNQDYPETKKEIIIIDGMSDDGTRTLIHEFQEKYPFIKLLDNPNKILATGWNIGIKAAKGEFICRIDAHNEPEKNYISNGIDYIVNKQNIACIGGLEINTGTTFWGEIAADLYTSKFGAGAAAYRSGLKSVQETDTAKCAIYPKSIFEKFGYFNESLGRNQDLEFHQRLVKNELVILTNPEMKNKYFVRSSPKKLLKKGFDDGFWTAYSGSYYLRHLVPMLFLICLVLVTVGFIIFTSKATLIIFLSPILLYTIFALYFAFSDGKTFASKLLLTFIFFLYHIVYGFGSIFGFFKKLFR